MRNSTNIIQNLTCDPVVWLLPVIATLLLLSPSLNGQNLDQYRWENRLLVFLSESVEHPDLNDQIRHFSKEKVSLAERKLLIFTITPDAILSGIDQREISSVNQYHNLKRTDSPIETILIGLDGGVKLRRTDVIKPKDLYAIIDGMPMRRAEIRRKKSGNP